MNSETIDTEGLRASVDLVALVGKYVALRRRGDVYTGLCPFHAEKTRSFYVYPDRHYHCFGCGTHGDCISFVMAISGVDFKEATKQLGAGMITAASYREHIEARRARAAEAAAKQMSAYPWWTLWGEYAEEQEKASAEWEAENSPAPTDFELWVIQGWLKRLRSEAFRETAEYEYLMAEWERWLRR